MRPRQSFCSIPFIILAVSMASTAAANWIDVAHGDGAGSFEVTSAPIEETGPGFVRLAAGSPLISGWTIAGDGVDVLIAPTHVAADGDLSIDLAAVLPGRISTTIPTFPGAAYQLTFQAYGGLQALPENDGRVVAGDLEAIFTPPRVPSAGSATYTEFEYSFTATSAVTVIQFEGLTVGGGFGPVIDDVVVPEPGGLPAIFGGSSMLVFMSFRRRARVRRSVHSSRSGTVQDDFKVSDLPSSQDGADARWASRSLASLRPSHLDGDRPLDRSRCPARAAARSCSPSRPPSPI